MKIYCLSSATWPPDVQRLAESYMTNPMQIYIGSLDLAAVHSVEQVIEIVHDSEKREWLNNFLTEHLKSNQKVIVFGSNLVIMLFVIVEFSKNYATGHNSILEQIHAYEDK